MIFHVEKLVNYNIGKLIFRQLQRVVVIFYFGSEIKEVLIKNIASQETKEATGGSFQTLTYYCIEKRKRQGFLIKYFLLRAESISQSEIAKHNLEYT